MESHDEQVARVKTLTAIAENERFIPSKEGLDSHHKAANAFFNKHTGANND